MRSFDEYREANTFKAVICEGYAAPVIGLKID